MGAGRGADTGSHARITSLQCRAPLVCEMRPWHAGRHGAPPAGVPRPHHPPEGVRPDWPGGPRHHQSLPHRTGKRWQRLDRNCLSARGQHSWSSDARGQGRWLSGARWVAPRARGGMPAGLQESVQECHLRGLRPLPSLAPRRLPLWGPLGTNMASRRASCSTRVGGGTNTDRSRSGGKLLSRHSLAGVGTSRPTKPAIMHVCICLN